MAQEQSPAPTKVPWTRIFTAFKIALDLKKMLLAAVGIVLVWVGWTFLGWTFYGMHDFPEWKNFEPPKDKSEEKPAQWTRFKAKRQAWNLMHELAGSPGDSRRMDAADVADQLEEFEVLYEWEQGKLNVTEVAAEVGKAAKEGRAAEAGKQEKDKQDLYQRAHKIFLSELVTPRIKPSGKLRVSPWSEDRGGNPYLLVSETVKTRGDNLSSRGSFIRWLCGEQAPVLLEPLFKFLTPIVYLFDARAGFWARLYLVALMLWTLTIWGFFGGAICRIAAVQVARNERISLREAISFTRDRFVSYIAAPAFPMALLAIFVVVLVLFGLLEWTPIVGDVFAGLFWPVVLLIGLIMAVVLVGLIGWPLMIATISTEGTDSFDALSRSYSYVYQAPWQYLWYSVVAVFYGAVLVFFVGFMASLLVFVGKWGVSCAPLGGATAEDDRDPSYLFWYAPTSFGWRDLLISSSSFTRKEGGHLEFTPEYESKMRGWNYTGAALVSIWIWPLFLLVVGFGYSYFWSASTIIYFLMRQHVDDTEMDEVHMEDEDLDDPFMKPAAPTAPASAEPDGKPGTLSLNVVDAPAPAPPPAETAAEPPLPLADTPPPSDGHT